MEDMRVMLSIGANFKDVPLVVKDLIEVGCSSAWSEASALQDACDSLTEGNVDLAIQHLESARSRRNETDMYIVDLMSILLGYQKTKAEISQQELSGENNSDQADSSDSSESK
mgnify:CR=1 FL=1